MLSGQLQNDQQRFSKIHSHANSRIALSVYMGNQSWSLNFTRVRLII